ncbi:hypothetical protein GCM10010329_76010 [Streptomyces spiroverticillatus]|uniref:DUF742 domain-containing protein n=1 Tax=Streptomyces finlayi TaxID=67296 RepID=A0A919CG32_9ACTN|nr:DUF742 domain-containing protein [Streptomyces finlayi]GHA41844.1 hypothetical protein GCM10010329_76010 [Streptomyces spiroverticillatus]GHD17380.1 hypothetical protein GCM10010334_79240 [Streptomyces finlayi]
MNDAGSPRSAGTPGSQERETAARGRAVPGARQQDAHFFDADAGPVVRPYAMTRGRTSSATRHRLDLIAIVIPEPAADDPDGDHTLAPEHVEIVQLCQDSPQSIAELAATLDLPVGVVRVLVGDLVEEQLVHVTRPVEPAELPDESLLREVIDGLRAL